MSKQVFKNTAQMIATFILVALFAASILTPLVLSNLDEKFRNFYYILPIIYIVGVLLSCLAYWKSEPETDESAKEARTKAVLDQSA